MSSQRLSIEDFHITFRVAATRQSHLFQPRYCRDSHDFRAFRVIQPECSAFSFLFTPSIPRLKYAARAASLRFQAPPFSSKLSSAAAFEPPRRLPRRHRFSPDICRQPPAVRRHFRVQAFAFTPQPASRSCPPRQDSLRAIVTRFSPAMRQISWLISAAMRRKVES